jgi:isopentenyldiphosphate isomerase
MNEPHTEEMLDLVDENDHVIGQIERNEAYKRGYSNFRVIDAFIKNNEGKLFIPRRHENKRLFPGALDCSVGGHVTSGDSYEETLKKEAFEELNLDIDRCVYKKLGVLTPHEDGVANFITVYEILSDETPTYNQNDFTEHYWLTPGELLHRITHDGDSAKGNLPKILQKFYL